MNTRIDPSLLWPAPARPLVLRNPLHRQRPTLIGQILLDIGEISGGDLIKAIAMRAREDARFGDILLANHMVSEDGLFRGLAIQFKCDVADLIAEPPDYRLVETIGAPLCLRYGIVPWKRIGAVTLIATSQPDKFAAIRDEITALHGQVLMVVAPERDIQRALLLTCNSELAERAESRVAARESCRGWNPAVMARLTAAALIVLVAGIIAAPDTTLLILVIWAIIALIFNTGLKAAATLVTYRSSKTARLIFQSRRVKQQTMRLPKISILVPLYQEREIAGRLVRRLGRINYPRELLDICLVVEEYDTVTQAALSDTNLPFWMRQIVVPDAKLKTKPRAMNYALDFCKGSLIGVYDAEDAPEPDQLYKVARRFHERGPELACLQGVLDFYNSRTNWLSRCFTIEYATWFRVMLPGLERLGFVIPLGGTTVFFRRDALEKIGGWDAHNVTEDADLGVRLARRGYRTEMIAALTEEEANCRAWPWVRQRSRWLKGYAITWAVHMRNPARLLADLGLWRFFGVQVLFVGSLSQFLLAPLLWSFWALPLGLHHPLQDTISQTSFYLLTGFFLSAELVTFLVSVFALSTNRHRGLWLWIPTLHLYFPLATIAAYKAIWELMTKPFFWDKTAHGQTNYRDQKARNRPGLRNFLRFNPLTR